MNTIISVIAHNIRSTHNVGALLRTCDGLGIEELIFSGYTPYPAVLGDTRLPHIAAKISKQIHKTALGAETSQTWSYMENPTDAMAKFRKAGYQIIALEQHPDSIILQDYQSPEKLCLLLGEEVNGIDAELIKLCDTTIEIPMLGQKESYNVAIAAAMALYRFRFCL